MKDSSLSVTVDTYTECITDLIGIRALHLFKDDWRDIHEFVTRTWNLNEDPIAYYRDGDSEAQIESFRHAGCKAEVHPFGYRSIHYLIKSQPAKTVQLVELQARTIFEEGWSEIDHRVRYPRESDNPYLSGFLTIFNRLAGSADEMGTFTKLLSSMLREQSQKAAAAKKEIEEKEAALKRAVSELQISQKEKSKLEGQIAALRTSSIPAVTVEGSAWSRAATALSSVSLDWDTVKANIDYDAISRPIGPTVLGQRQCSKCHRYFKSDNPYLINLSEPELCPDCKITGPSAPKPPRH